MARQKKKMLSKKKSTSKRSMYKEFSMSNNRINLGSLDANLKALNYYVSKKKRKSPTKRN